MLKLNMGCGQNKLAGYVNVDKFRAAEPDVLLDLEQPEWSWVQDGLIGGWEADSVDEVLFNHSLEHMGADPAVFLRIMQNLYRICRHEAVIQINVPHPRHDDFIGDPTHVRVITPQVLSLFSRKNCARWAAIGAANTPLATYLGVDFELQETRYKLAHPWAEMKDKGLLSVLKLDEAIARHNNVIREIRMTVMAVKDTPRVVPA